MRILLRLLVLTAAAGLAGCDEDEGPGADFAFQDGESQFDDFDEQDFGADTGFFQDDDPTDEFGFDTGVFNGQDDPSFGFGGSPEGSGFGNDFVDDAPFDYDTGVFTADPGFGGDPLSDGAFGRP